MRWQVRDFPSADLPLDDVPGFGREIHCAQ
jgi:hypothetical protein